MVIVKVSNWREKIYRAKTSTSNFGKPSFQATFLVNRGGLKGFDAGSLRGVP